MEAKDQENYLKLLKAIAEAQLNMEKNFLKSFGPEGAVTKQLNDIVKALIAISAKK